MDNLLPYFLSVIFFYFVIVSCLNLYIKKEHPNENLSYGGGYIALHCISIFFAWIWFILIPLSLIIFIGHKSVKLVDKLYEEKLQSTFNKEKH
jgi:hypothetical protein